MIRFAAFVALIAGITGQGFAVETGATVRFRDLTLKVPPDWEQEEPNSRLRLGQFRIPAAKDDKADAELAIFSFGAGGGIDSNIRRWVGQFQPEQRKLQITSGKSEQGQYFLVDLSGTYNQPVGPPIQRMTKPVPGTRMLSVILVIEEKGVYFLKLVGPQETVGPRVAAFRESFGGDADQEKEYKLADEGGGR